MFVNYFPMMFIGSENSVKATHPKSLSPHSGIFDLKIEGLVFYSANTQNTILCYENISFLSATSPDLRSGQAVQSACYL